MSSRHLSAPFLFGWFFGSCQPAAPENAMTKSSLSDDNAPDTDCKAQLRRLLEAVGCETYTELSRVLKLNRAAVSNAKRRENIPWQWLVELLEKRGINPVWILHGKGAKRLNWAETEQSAAHVLRITEVRPPEKCSSQDLIDELTRRSLQNANTMALLKELGVGRRFMK